MTPPRILDGKAIAAAVLDECRAEAAALQPKGIMPGLAVVLVGEDPASQVYVGSKARTCAELGFHSRKIELPATTTQTGVAGSRPPAQCGSRHPRHPRPVAAAAPHR